MVCISHITLMQAKCMSWHYISDIYTLKKDMDLAVHNDWLCTYSGHCLYCMYHYSTLEQITGSTWKYNDRIHVNDHQTGWTKLLTEYNTDVSVIYSLTISRLPLILETTHQSWKFQTGSSSPPTCTVIYEDVRNQSLAEGKIWQEVKRWKTKST